MSQSLPHHTIIAVVGAGAMGAGIAQVAASAGHFVKLSDARAGAAETAVEGIRAQFARLSSKGKMTEESATAASERLSAVGSLADLADAGLIIEAIIEDLGAKQRLFADLESLVSPDCLFATNTSSISVTAIGAGLKHPERLAGMHFFNPAPLMALVEIVSGLATDAGIAHALFETAQAWGKIPVHASSTPGFIVNRVARPYYGEALRQLHEGVADYATLDALMREAGGFRMGPFELMDLIGLDVNFAVSHSVWQAFFHDPRFTPSPLQREYVAAGWLGRKSGRGFYDYAENALNREAVTERENPLPENIVLVGDSPLSMALADRLTARGVSFGRQSEGRTGQVAKVGSACLMLTDGRPALRRARDIGEANTVIVDLALDYNKATRLAVAVAETCSADAAASVFGLLQGAGYALSCVKDGPGLPVMRTLAMLANEAADAVNQNVAAPDAVDTAMRLGVGYPRGPLEWARAVGFPVICEVLHNLALCYGEDRYRISPWLQQQTDAFLMQGAVR